MKQETSQATTEVNLSKLEQANSAKKSINFDDDLSSVCMKSEASFFSKLPEPETPEKAILPSQSQLDIEMVADVEEKQGLIDPSEDEDESSFKRRHKKTKRKKKFNEDNLTNKGNADHLQIEVVKRGRAKQVKLVLQDEASHTVAQEVVKTWAIGSERADVENSVQLNDSRAEFLERPSQFLESGDHEFVLLSVNAFGCIFYWVLSVMTAGVLVLLDFNFEWRFYNLMKWKFVDKVDQATGVLVNGEHGKTEYLPLRREEICLHLNEAASSQIVVFKNGSKYYFNQGSKNFRNVREVIYRTRVTDLVEKNKRGLKHSSLAKLRSTFGANVLNFETKFSITSCVFQLYHFLILAYAVALWRFGHSVYAFVLTCCFVVSVTRTLLRKKQKEDVIRRHFEIKEKVMVLRRSDEGINIKNIINSEELVPFDVVEVSNQSRVPADMVIIHGRCLVSSERGSHMRSAIPSGRNCDLDSLEDAHFLRAGEKVEFTINNVNEGVFAMVIGTGLGTLQGFELRKLLANMGRRNRYVSQVQTFLKRNSLWVVILASLVLMTEIFIFRSKQYIQFGSGVYNNTLRVFEILLVLVKPVALLLMKYVDDLGLLRLTQQKVEINQLNTFANQLQNIKSVLVEDSNLAKSKNEIGGFLLTEKNKDDRFCLFRKPIKKAETLHKRSDDSAVRQFLKALGCCNNSAKINHSLYGSKADNALIRASGFDILFESSSSEKLNRVFSCEAANLRLTERRVIESDQTVPLFSVIVQDESRASALSFAKGDPATIEQICVDESIPLNFEDTVRKYSNKGFRLMAICGKELGSGSVETQATNTPRAQIETQMTFLGLVLFKKKVNNKSQSLVCDLRQKQLNVQLMSSQNVHDSLNTASHAGLFHQNRISGKDSIDLGEEHKTKAPLVLGTTFTRNNVEKLVFNELKVKNETHLEKRERASLDLTTKDFILTQNVELVLTGRAFQLLAAESDVELLRAIMSKTKVFAELGFAHREAIINASVGSNGPFEKTVYVQTEREHERGKNHSSTEYKRENVFNDLRRDSIEQHFSRNADLTVNVAFLQDLHQQLTSNCSLSGDLLGLSQLVSQGRDLAALNRQLVDFLLFVVWTQLLGLFLLYARGVSLSKTDFFLLDILFVFGISWLFSMSVRHLPKPKNVRSSLLVSSTEQSSLRQKASNQMRRSNLAISCILGALVLYSVTCLLHREPFYKTPQKMDQAHSTQAQHDLYPDVFVVFSTLGWLYLSYFFTNLFAPTQHKTVSKSRALLYSLGLLGLLLYFQGLTLAHSPGAVARVLHIPYLGVFAVKQLFVIALGFLVLLVAARVITSVIVNKSLVKQVQAKETSILEKHIRSTNTLPPSLEVSASKSEVMRKIEKIDVEKLEKESQKAQKELEKTQVRKEFRFVEREGNSISLEIS